MWKRAMLIGMTLRADARRLWRALRHPDTPTWFKGGVVLAVLYLLSPLELLPDMLPVIGVVDDLVLVPLTLRWLLGRLPAHIAAPAASPPEA